MFPFVCSGCGQDTVMLLAARLTWCITGTAEGTEVQSGELPLGGLEPLGAAAPTGGEDRLENVLSNAGWLESRDGEEGS